MPGEMFDRGSSVLLGEGICEDGGLRLLPAGVS